MNETKYSFINGVPIDPGEGWEIVPLDSGAQGDTWDWQTRFTGGDWIPFFNAGDNLTLKQCLEHYPSALAFRRPIKREETKLLESVTTLEGLLATSPSEMVKIVHLIVGDGGRCMCGVYNGTALTCKEILAMRVGEIRGLILQASFGGVPIDGSGKETPRALRKEGATEETNPASLEQAKSTAFQCYQCGGDFFDDRVEIHEGKACKCATPIYPNAGEVITQLHSQLTTLCTAIDAAEGAMQPAYDKLCQLKMEHPNSVHLPMLNSLKSALALIKATKEVGE